MRTIVTLTIGSKHWAPQTYLNNAQACLIERAVQQAIDAEVASEFMKANNKPYLGTPDQIAVKVLRKDIDDLENKPFSCAAEIMYEAKNPVDAAKQFVNNTGEVVWYIDVKDLETGKVVVVDTAAWSVSDKESNENE